MSSVARMHLFAREQKARSARSSMNTPRSSMSSPTESARSSTQEPRSTTPAARVHKSNVLKTAAQKALQALKQHHRDVNSAFDAVYGTHYYTKEVVLTGKGHC